MLGPGDVEDGGGAALLPAAEAVVEPDDVGETVRIGDDLTRRVLDDRGNEVVGDLHELFVDLFVVFGVAVSENMNEL